MKVVKLIFSVETNQTNISTLCADYSTETQSYTKQNANTKIKHIYYIALQLNHIFFIGFIFFKSNHNTHHSNTNTNQCATNQQPSREKWIGLSLRVALKNIACWSWCGRRDDDSRWLCDNTSCGCDINTRHFVYMIYADKLW